MKTDTKQRSRDFAEGDILNKDSQYAWADSKKNLFFFLVQQKKKTWNIIVKSEI